MLEDSPSLTECLADLSSSDTFTSIQSQIINRGQEIEQFIKEYEETDNPLFHLLTALFSLFKSEVSTGISLRQTLLARKREQLQYEKDKKTIESLITSVQNINPSVKTIEDVVQLYSQVKVIAEDREKLQRLDSLVRKKRAKDRALEKQIADSARHRDLLVKYQQQTLAEMKEKERILKEQTAQLREEKTNAEKEYEDLNTRFEAFRDDNSLERLREVVDNIDSRLENLTKEMEILNSRHTQKVEKLHSKIERTAFSVEELESAKAELENDLDNIHRKIERLTNPHSGNDDPSVSPFAARNILESQRREVRELEDQLQKEERRQQQLKERIESAKFDIATHEKKKLELGSELDTLAESIEHEQSIVRKLEEDEAEITKRVRNLRDMEEQIRHTKLANRKLARKLEERQNRAKKLSLNNSALSQAIQILEGEITDLGNEQPLTEEEKVILEQMEDAFTMMRSEFCLPGDTRPEDILKYVERYCA